MKTSPDVLVVGGGPCGSFTALTLAKLGIGVTVFEEHSEIGVPAHCPGHLSIDGLKLLGLHPLPTEIVENSFRGAVFCSPRGKKFFIHFSSPKTCVVNRVLFDQYITEMAKHAGANFFLESHVESPIIKNNFVQGVKIKRERNNESFAAKIVVDAEGISSRILRQAGLSTFDSEMLVNGVQAEVDNVRDLIPDTVEVYLGKEYAPGLYAWLIPTCDERAKIGLAAKAGNPKMLLRRLMLKHPEASKKLHKARILQMSFHPISLGGPIPKTYSNGFLAVGDAASHVKPTTGGGLIFGMACARIAANVIREALEKNDLSSESLSRYQKRCEEILRFDLKFMLRARRMLNTLSDNKIDRLVDFCAKIGLERPLENIRELDFQGRSFLSILWNPRFTAVLLYLVLLNPFC